MEREGKNTAEAASLEVKEKDSLTLSSRLGRNPIFAFFRLLFSTEPTWLDIFLIVFGTVTAAAAGVPFPLLGIVFGQLVDKMNSATCAAQGDLPTDPYDYQDAINKKVSQTAYIGAIAMVLIYCYIVTWTIISQRLAHRMRSQYVGALLRQPPSFFDLRSAAGEVSSRLHGDIMAVQDGAGQKVGVVITSFSFFITVFVIAFTKQPRLAGMLVSMVPVYLTSIFVGSHFVKKFLGQTQAVGDASSIASEALTRIPVVRAFSAARRLEIKFSEYMATARTAGIKKAGVSALQAGMLYFVSYSSIALAFWQGSRMIAHSMGRDGADATIGEIYSVVYLLIDACVLLGNLAPMLPAISAASAAYLRLIDDINAPSAVDGLSDTGNKLAPSQNKAITFRNVTFEYPSRPGQSVLRNVSMDFPAGSYTAVVGLSGSGKSTIAALVDRLYDPKSGVIELDGNDITTLNVKNLRSFIGFVQQDPSLLDRSIWENIALGLANSPKPEHDHLKALLYGDRLSKFASKGKGAMEYAASQGPEFKELVDLVTRAAEQADAVDFVQKLHEGFGTIVGPRGSLLSGGQRQRIALARALIRDPEILVLDEATSALDSASEKRIQLAVEQAAKGNRTVISIAHRLSTIRNADNIIVMEAGQVIEQGSYETLVGKEDGAFANMVKLQSAGGDLSDSSSSLRRESVATAVQATDNDDDVADDKVPKEDKVEIDGDKSDEDPKEKKAPAKDGELETAKKFGPAMKGLWPLVRPNSGFLILALIAAFIVGCTFSGSGLIFGNTVGALNPCKNSAERILSLGRLFSGLMFMLAVIEFFANFFSWFSFGVISERLLYSLRVLSFRALLEQDLQWHQSGNRTAGGLLEIITRDCASVGGFSGSTFGTVFAVCVNIIVSVILSHIVGWKIAVVCLVIVPIMLGAGFMNLHMLARYAERHVSAFSSATSVATEAIHSIRTVAALSLESHFMESYFHLLEKPRKDIVIAAASANIWLALNHTISPFLNALAYWWGSKLMLRGEYTQTEFLIIFMAMLTAAKIWASMFTLAPEFSRAYSSLCRLLTVIELSSNSLVDQRAHGTGASSAGSLGDIEKTAEPRPKAILSDQGGVRISFKDVSFSYPNRPDSRVLDNVSFEIAKNQFVGLVGPSGAGKSTIMNLVQQLYSPTEGTATIDGQDVTTGLDSLRDSIALVPQDPSLFQGSVRFNVGLGAPSDREATQEEIEEACRLANIHDVIVSLPDGYDTECGPSASHLSGGQKQRLAIARALVRRPRLLLLDESSSALDAASEAALQEGLEKVARATTVLAITHRLHTVAKADTIFVLEAGKIVDSGRHTELMQRSQSYRINAMQQMLQGQELSQDIDRIEEEPST
ncbi:ABC-type multidrug transport system, ATPase and permease component [Geosmithia morbida]|uniref:ABC-type multidrug transport system, ATPase and permease component n=1 Tax=Geosmithia morbida TaxID=1094350 RepID=A0A9P5D3U9_9HYPO|nr:ABC-type multidrug transport system, ATPase and permease component [Geosmithia morbida]KAF4122881.1 ABC-type multidrug transport system, ATPase and permease component [Geosmithia morbida]